MFLFTDWGEPQDGPQLEPGYGLRFTASLFIMGTTTDEVHIYSPYFDYSLGQLIFIEYIHLQSRPA